MKTKEKFKIRGRKINNLRYADGTTLLPDKPEKLKWLVKKRKEESARASLQLKMKKNERHNYGNDKQLYNR